ncbi:MAG: 23S rRNA (pseudouridine(1915)-N(3))-methyltransferase RlmH [Terriglobales bacterium]
MRLRIFWIGKTKDPAVTLWTAEYLKRISRFAQIAAEEIPARGGEPELLQRLGRTRPGAQSANSRLVLLDPAGRRLDSAQFAAYLEQSFAQDGRELALAIGGPDGFSANTRAAAQASLSLSPMTYSHELARAMLLEQVYRALALLNHHPYPR